MFEKRLRGYRAIGYKRHDDPLSDGADSGELPDDDRTAEMPTTSCTRKTRGSDLEGQPESALQSRERYGSRQLLQERLGLA